MERGLIATLFDRSFDVFLTTKLVRFTYVTSGRSEETGSDTGQQHGRIK